MKTPGFHSLGARLSFWIALLGAAVFISVLGVNYFLSRYLLEDYIGDLARTTASSTVRKLETVFSSVATSADALASVVSTTGISEKQIREAIRAFMKTSNTIFGMTVALEPHVLQQNIGRFSPYYYRKDGGLAYADLATTDYNYQKWDWYTQPKALNQPVWSEPYLDTGGGGILMTTYSVPFYAGQKNTFAGVATADIALDWLDGLVKNIHIADSGFGFIVSNNDIVIAHPNPEFNMQPLQAMLGERVNPANWQRYLSRKDTESNMYFYGDCRHRQDHCWTAVESLGATGWKVFIVLPEQELIAGINQLTIRISVIAVGGLLLLLLVVVLISHHLTNPLGRLAQATRDIGSGNLDASLPEPARADEIGSLTSDFTRMRDELIDYITELRESTAKRQKIESEIQIASDIQMSMISGAGHADVVEAGYQLFALLRPARSVGGDLYYYQQKGDELHFIIGDVSDKGVPAALFMAKAITLYTGALGDGLTPGRIFNHMNDALCQHNDACMFVTALCGRLNICNGELLMANAGHMHPIKKTQQQSGELIIDGGTALGLMEGLDYDDVSLRIADGSLLVMYTDGISEAFSYGGEQYSEQRLFDFVGTSDFTQSKQLGDAIIQDVDNFSNDAEQSDDITLMVLRFDGRS